MKNEVSQVEELLRRKTHVLIYNGQNDLIVETPGTFKWAERIHYDDAQKFRYFILLLIETHSSQYGKQDQRNQDILNPQVIYN
jgi:hypothetical protein